MIWPVEIRPVAATEIDEAYRWYEQERIGLGDEFLDALRARLISIHEHPEQYPVIHRQTRRALLDRFPYALYYRILPERVVVVACFHGRRSPRSWQSRR